MCVTLITVLENKDFIKVWFALERKKLLFIIYILEEENFMKKTILATTLALGLGVTGVAAGQDAEASSIDKAELAHTAQNNPEVLNASAVHEGAYDYNFNHGNFNYDFESDGTNYSWAYSGTGEAQAQTQAVEKSAPAVQEETQNVQYSNYTEEVQAPAQNTQAAAPAVEEVEQPAAASPAPAEKTQQSTGGSTKSQFLAAGGTEAMWNSIVLPESSGNPNAVSPNGYQGLGQTKESWGTGSVAEQTSGMLNYAKKRYGSVDAAIQFRNANNWW